MKRMIKASQETEFELELTYPDYEIDDGVEVRYVDIYQYGPYEISVDKEPNEKGNYTWTVIYNPAKHNPEDVSADNIVDSNYFGSSSYDQALTDAVSKGIKPNRSYWEK